jgi:type III secretion protein N (ATPase)
MNLLNQATTSRPASLQPGADRLVAELEQTFGRITPVGMRGRVSKAVGLLIDATGIQAHVGELCELVTPGEPPLPAEVVGFNGNTAVLTPLGPLTGLSALTQVVPTGRGHTCRWGPACWDARSAPWASPSTAWGRWRCTSTCRCTASRWPRWRAA